MKEGLFYSEEALLNRLLFYSSYNDIDIFVEDEDKEYIYENIFQRMFRDKIHINKILPMKGKKGVERAYREYGNEFDGKPAIYLVDGDFDLIMDKEMIDSLNYIYLERYNIESYYIDEKAVVKYMAGKMKTTQKNVSEVIEFGEWKREVYDAMKELFLNYLMAQELFPNDKNVGISPHIYFLKDGHVNYAKLEDYTNQLKTRVTDYDVKYISYKQKFEVILFGDISRLVCGKYLLASLSKYLREKGKVNFKEDDFVYYLISFFDIKTLDYVKNRIISIIAGGYSAESRI